MAPNHAFESGRAEEQRALSYHLSRRTAQRERYVSLWGEDSMKGLAEAAFASVMAILISGCAATQAYDGPSRSREQVAVITGMSGWEITNMGIAARVIKIDGKELAEASSKIEVLPGKHEIEVECWMQRIPKSTNVNSIDAEAGVDYLIFIGAKDGKCFTRILNKRR